MLRYALKLTRDRDKARDLAQRVMQRALENEDNYREIGRLNSWLANITFRLYCDSRRSARRDLTELHDSLHGWFDGTRNQWVEKSEHACLARDGEHESSDIRRDVARAFGTLSRTQRQVAKMALLQGYDYREIAKKLRLPLGTVRSRLSRAREVLRVAMAAYTPPPRRRHAYPAQRAPAA